MALSATSNVISSNTTNTSPSFFVNLPKTDGVQFTKGLPEGLVVMSNSGTSTIGTQGGQRLGTTTTSSTTIASGTGGMTPLTTGGVAVKGRISWHELVR
jgi:hypothetical protein